MSLHLSLISIRLMLMRIVSSRLVHVLLINTRARGTLAE